MTIFLDTSTLVAALIHDHESHTPAVAWLECVKQRRVETVLSAHALAELYATLSVIRTRPALTPADVLELICDNVLPFVTLRTVTARQYVALLRRLAAAGLRGGVVYDAVHAEVARRAGVDRLVTLNPRHYLRVWSGSDELIVSPLTTSPP